ncbi:MAG TPA: hypothetical protein VM262_10145 [Acidimicrobiales bacterium]|nr:hypothetical protein [Acidimicrobiales bacterium]
MGGDGSIRDRAVAAVAAAEAERARLDAALDRGEAAFSEVAAANARVRQARAALEAIDAGEGAEAGGERG